MRQSLETERKKHREMKQIFDETMQNIEAQKKTKKKGHKEDKVTNPQDEKESKVKINKSVGGVVITGIHKESPSHKDIRHMAQL